jgi:hypothetical protein
VHATESVAIPGGAVGTVIQKRMQDDGAWIRLDTRSDVPGVHPFPANDDSNRGRHVLAYPSDCEDTGEVDEQIASQMPI